MKERTYSFVKLRWPFLAAVSQLETFPARSTHTMSCLC
jgi:hypothetical protein